MAHIAAVLTGDLIGSTKAGADAVDRTMGHIGQAADTLARWTGESTRFTRFRGDGWQIYLAVPGLVLRSVLFLAATLKSQPKSLSTRMAAGIEDVDRLGQTDLSDATGAAFVVSGQALDAMPRTRQLVLDGGLVPGWQTAFFPTAEWQAHRWSALQAEAMVLALDPAAGARAAMADRLSITRQALQARLDGAGFDPLDSMLQEFERHDYTRLPA